MDDNDARITVEVERSYLPPSQFESLFLSVKHTEKDIERFLEAFKLL